MSKVRQLEVPASSSYFNSPAWYLRERVPVTTVKDKRTRKYFELEEQISSDGARREVLVEKDYPITPEYVSSFAAGSDYRADPVAAINAAPQRRNLGDVTNLQKALGLDSETAQHLYNEFRAAAERYAQKQAAAQETRTPAPAGKEGE